MSAVRSASTRALKHLSLRGQHVRQLHMTGPDTFPSMTMTTTKAILPTPSPTKQEATPSTRHFNTSRSLKAPKDSSTIDFAFLPSFAVPADANMDPAMRIPLLHSNYNPSRTGALGKLSDEPMPVHRPIIVTASSETTHISSPSAMAEVHDHNGMPDLPDAAIAVTQAFKAEAKAATGFFRQVLGGMVDDVFGAKRGAAHA